MMTSQILRSVDFTKTEKLVLEKQACLEIRHED